MALFNINDLSIKEMGELLENLDGITPLIAQKISVYAEKKRMNQELAFSSKEELLSVFKKMGLNSKYMKGIGKAIEVGDADGSEFKQYLIGFELDEKKKFKLSDEKFKMQDEEEVPQYPIGEIPKVVKRNRPLVFIPGITGSELNIVDDSGFATKIWPPIGVNGIDNLKNLAETLKSGKKLVTGNISLDAYSGIITNLALRGYTANNNLLIFTYDWTKSNKLNGQLLAVEIGEFLNRFNKLYGTNIKEVDAICHSMGGLLCKSAILNNKAPVRKTVYVATPHYGAPKAYFTIREGIMTVGALAEFFFDLFDLYRRGFNVFRSTEDFDDLAEALNVLAKLTDSVYELLPNAFYLDEIVMLYVISQARLIGRDARIGKDKTYWIGKSMLSQSDIPRAKRATEFIESLGKIPPKQHLMIACHDLPTKDEVIYNERLIGNVFEEPTASGRQGDETVPIFSATCGGRGNYVYISQQSHAVIPNTKETFEIIKRYLGI